MSTYHGSQCSTLQIGFLCRFVPPFVGSKYITPMKKYIVLSKIANNSWNRLRLCVFRRMGNGDALEIGEYAFLSKRWLGAWNGPLIIVVLHALLVFLFGANKQSKIHLLRLISAEKQGWSTSQKIFNDKWIGLKNDRSLFSRHRTTPSPYQKEKSIGLMDHLIQTGP